MGWKSGKEDKESMNTQSKKEMKKILKEFTQYKLRNIRIADFGSYDVNGTYKAIVPDNWIYTGIDIVEGPNVDVVIDKSYNTYISSNTFDVVISGGTLEHCENPFKLVEEMARILIPGGTMIINAPQVRYEHGTRSNPKIRFKDYWRFNPEGLELLLEKAEITVIKSYVMKRHSDSYSMIVGKK